MAASNAVVIRSAYRELLKSIKVAFAGDSRLLSQAHTEAKTSFRKIPTDTNITNDTKSGVNIASQQGVEHALSVAKILRENVVQGEASSENPHHLSKNIMKQCIIINKID